MAAPNIVNVSSILGKTRGQPLTTTTTAGILTCSSDKVLKINSIIVSNVDGSNSADATIAFYDNDVATTYHLAKTVTVPNDATLIVVGNLLLMLGKHDQMKYMIPRMAILSLLCR